MNRLDRLSAILIHLQSKKVVTARELAQRFGISIRTVYRDIRSLEASGVPIGSEPGAGYFLAEGYSLTPVMFTSAEAGALLLAGKLAGEFSDAETKRNFDSALYKIKAVLKDRDKEFVFGIETKIDVFETAAESPPQEDHYIQDIQQALYQNRVIDIHYNAAYTDQTTVREIEPVSLVFYGDHWHLIAFCRLRNAYRDFRLDRIGRLSITEQGIPSAHPPIDVIFKIMFESKERSNVVLRVNNDRTYETIKNKYHYGILEETDLGDSKEISLVTDSLPVLAKWLLSFGQDVEVLYPLELISIMRQYAEEIAHRYLGD